MKRNLPALIDLLDAVRRGQILPAVLLTTVVLGLLAVASGVSAAPSRVAQKQQGIPFLVFTNPFGEVGTGRYGPRIQRNSQNVLIEDTSFGVKNPDLVGATTCFGVAFNQLWHAGVDYYDTTIQPSQGGTIPNVPVRAVANGIVRFAQNVNYPGWVVIIVHNTGAGSVFSVYSHLTSVPSSIFPSASVTRGTVVGNVLAQPYSGAYPAFHTSDDSHLHFEIRTFYDATDIYLPNYPSCDRFVPGEGYNHPTHPSVFPNSTTSYYIEPISFIRRNQVRMFIPAALRRYNPVPSPEPPAGYP